MFACNLNAQKYEKENVQIVIIIF